MRAAGRSLVAAVVALGIGAGCNTASSSTSTSTSSAASTSTGPTGSTTTPTSTPAPTATPTPPSPAPDDTGPVVGGCVRSHVDCAKLAPTPDFNAGQGPKNATFPPPPPGSGLCGTAGMAMSYYLSTTSAGDLFAYYRTKLLAGGYTVKPPRRGGRPCDIVMEFEKGSKFGNVYFYGEQEAFSVAVPLE